jgi:hypothetical protein
MFKYKDTFYSEKWFKLYNEVLYRKEFGVWKILKEGKK